MRRSTKSGKAGLSAAHPREGRAEDFLPTNSANKSEWGERRFRDPSFDLIRSIRWQKLRPFFVPFVYFVDLEFRIYTMISFTTRPETSVRRKSRPAYR